MATGGKEPACLLILVVQEYPLKKIVAALWIVENPVVEGALKDC